MGQGWQRASGFNVFDPSNAENHRPAARVWVDGTCVQKTEITQNGLRGILEAVGGEPCFLKYVTFDIGRDGFRIARRLLGLPVVIQVIRPETLQGHEVVCRERLRALLKFYRRAARWVG